MLLTGIARGQEGEGNPNQEPPQFTGSTTGYRSPDLDAAFSDYEVYQIDVSAIAAHVHASDETVGFELLLGVEHAWILSLERVELRAPDYVARTSANPTGEGPSGQEAVHLRESEPWGTHEDVRLSVGDDFLWGYVRVSQDLMMIQPLWELEPGVPDDFFLVHSSSDLLAPPLGFECEALGAAGNGKEQASGGPQAREVDLATAADCLTYLRCGSVRGVNDRIMAQLNVVHSFYEGVFETDLVFRVREQFVDVCGGCPPDCDCGPWVPNPTPRCQGDFYTLTNVWFAPWAANGGFQQPHDVGILFAGTQPWRGSGGKAFEIGGVCRTGRKYAITVGSIGLGDCVPGGATIWIHELGHLFGAEHDPPGTNFIMTEYGPSDTCSATWSAPSIASIDARLANADCLAAAAPDLLVASASATPNAAMPGGTVRVSLEVRNGGTALSGPSTVGVHLSADALLSGDDPSLGTASVGSLARDTSSSLLVDVVVPAGTSSGARHLLVVADAAGAVAESDEANNVQPLAFLVETPPPLSAGTIAGDQGFCEGEGDPAPLTNLVAPSGGSGSLMVQWERRVGTGGTWGGIPGAMALEYDPPLLMTTTQYRRRVEDSMASSALSNVVTVTVGHFPALLPGRLTDYMGLCSGWDLDEVPQQEPPSGGTGDYDYQWQQRPNCGGPWSDIPGASELSYDPPPITSSVCFRRRLVDLCGTVYTNVFEVSVGPLPTAASIAPASQTLSSGETPEPIGASGGSYTGSVVWQRRVGCTGPWVDIPWSSIPDSTGFVLRLPPATETTCYRWVVTTFGCGAGTYPSNVATVEVSP